MDSVLGVPQYDKTPDPVDKLNVVDCNIFMNWEQTSLTKVGC